MKPAPAIFIGEQSGSGFCPGFGLYNLTADISGHPKGSTVSDITLRELGYAVPASSTVQKVRQRMKDSCNPFGL